MDNLTQGVIGWSLYTLITKKHTTKDFLLWAVIANVGDFDVFVGPLLSLGHIEGFFFHRGIMHSLLFAVLASLSIAGVLYYVDRSVSYRRYVLACFVAMLGWHLLIDAMTTYGMRFLLPWSNHTVSTDNIFVIDFGMWIITLGGFITYLTQRARETKQTIAARTLGCSALYFALSFGLQSYAGHTMHAQAPALTDQASYKTLAQPLQPLLWRQVIKDTDRYYVAYRSVLDRSIDVVRQEFVQDPKVMTELEALLSDDETLTHHYQLVKDFARDYLRVTRTASGYLLENMLSGPLLGREDDNKWTRPFNFEIIQAEDKSYHMQQVHNPQDITLTRDLWRKFWKRVGGY